jgi:hypothetical protein
MKHVRERFLSLILIMAFLFVAAHPVSGSEEMDALLKLLVKKGVITADDVAVLKEEVGKELAAEEQAKIQKRVQELLQQVESAEASALPSATASKPVKAIQIGGKLEFRYEDSQGEKNAFKLNEFELFTKVELDDHLSLKGKISTDIKEVEIEDAYVNYDEVPGIGGEIRAGKFRRRTFGLAQNNRDRVSLNFSLLADAFTSARVIGGEYMRHTQEGEFPAPATFGLGISQGNEISSEEAGGNADRPVQFVADDTPSVEVGQNQDYHFRTMVEPTPGLKVGGSALLGKLSKTDMAMLNMELGTSGTDETKQRYGADVTYAIPKTPLEWRAEYMYGKTGKLQTNTWYTMAMARDIIGSVDVYARYGRLNPNTAPTASSFTWELQQTTFGFVWPIYKTMQFQAEYAINEEDPPSGMDDVDNDMLLLEVQWEF